LIKLVEKKNKSKNQKPNMISLPDILEIHDFDTAIQLYQWLEATDWRWDINTLLEQPEQLMNDVAEIAGTVSKMEKMQQSDMMTPDSSIPTVAH
jgi:hypothetical protein